jgi:hypothetical protein
VTGEKRAKLRRSERREPRILLSLHRAARALTITALAALLAACVSRPAASSPSTTAPNVSSTFAAVENASSEPGPSPVRGPYAVAVLKLSDVRSLSLPSGVRIHRLDSWGPLVTFDEMGYGGDAGQGQRIWLADLSRGQVREIARTSDGSAAWTPQIDGSWIAWVEFRYSDTVRMSGPNSWRVMALDLATGEQHVVASGRNQRLEGPSAIPPVIAISDNDIAYSVEDPGLGRPFGWRVVVRTLSTNALVRTVLTDESIYALAISDTAVAWSEGLVDMNGDFKYKTRLMLSTTSQPTPIRVAADAFELSLQGGRLAWASDPGSSEGDLGAPQRPQIMTTLVSRPQPTAVSRAPDELERGGFWPAVGNGLVAWLDDQNTPWHPDPSTGHVVFWSATTGKSVQVEPIDNPGLVGVGQGWLIWQCGVDQPRIQGIPLTSIPSATQP